MGTAVVRDHGLYEQAATDPAGFWAGQARALSWFEPFGSVLNRRLPFAEWFVGGRLNVAFNCLDRHVEAGLGDKVAYFFEGEPGDRRTITYAELLDEGDGARTPFGPSASNGATVWRSNMPMIPSSSSRDVWPARGSVRRIRSCLRVLGRRPR